MEMGEVTHTEWNKLGGVYETAAGEECNKIPVEHSVEPGRHHLITVIPRPVHGQFKHRGRVQPTETSKNLKGLNEQAVKPLLLEGEESEIG